MAPLVLYPSQFAALGQLALSVVGGGLCLAIVLQVKDAGVIPLLMLVGAGCMGVISVRNLFSSTPKLVADDQGIHVGQALLPWDGIAAYQVTRGGIPIRLKIHFQSRSGPTWTVDLQELSMLPDTALAQLEQRVQHYRPELQRA